MLLFKYSAKVDMWFLIAFVETLKIQIAWWRHQIGTFSALLALCKGNPPVPSQRPVTRSSDFFSKQSRRRWFETPSRSSGPHCNGILTRNCIRRLAYFEKTFSWRNRACSSSLVLFDCTAQNHYLNLTKTCCEYKPEGVTQLIIRKWNTK